MNHSKQTVQTQQNTIASTLFQAESWKNAFIKLLPQHVIKNPVMAIVWLGTLRWTRALLSQGNKGSGPK